MPRYTAGSGKHGIAATAAGTMAGLFAADDPPHRGIAPETVGVVHILVSGEASIDRLAKQTDDAMPAVLARPAVGQDIARQCGQPQGIVEFTISVLIF